jgi:acyl-CoA thioester hydrolase
VTSGEIVHVEQVRFRDLDPMGVTYLAEVGAATGLEDMNIIVARVDIDFKAPVRMGQEIEICVHASRFGTKSFDLDYVLRVDGAVVAEATSVQVAYDYDRREPMALPAEWREKMAAVAA